MVSWLVILACYLPSTPTIFRGSPLKFKSDHVTFLPNALQWFLILLECDHTYSGLNDFFILLSDLIFHTPWFNTGIVSSSPTPTQISYLEYPHLDFWMSNSFTYFTFSSNVTFSMITCSDHSICFIHQLVSGPLLLSFPNLLFYFHSIHLLLKYEIFEIV